MSVTIVAVDPVVGSVSFDQTDYESIAGGVGGWEDIDRPRNTSALGWVGTPAKTLTLPLALDGMEAVGVGIDRSVEPPCALVASWGLPARGTGVPPILQVLGLVTVSPAERWVVDGIDWGPYVVNRDNVRVQQNLTLTLKRYQAADVVLGPAAKARAKQKKTKKKAGAKKPSSAKKAKK